MPIRASTSYDLVEIFNWHSTTSSIGLLPFGSSDIELMMDQDNLDTRDQFHSHVTLSGELNGLIHITRHASNDPKANIAYIVRPTIGDQAIKSLIADSLRYAFRVLKLRKLSIEVLTSDLQNINFLKNIGFQQEGQLRCHHFDGKEFADVTLLAFIGNEQEVNLDDAIVQITSPADQELHQTKTCYRVTILTDHDSWLIPYTAKLMNLLAMAGHHCELVNNIENASGGDFCFCLSFSQIVSAEYRQQYRHTLVVHESELPKGRGWAPMTWQILEGASRIPVALLEAEDRVDSGVIYLHEYIDLNGSELNSEWRSLQADATIRLCMKWIEQYPLIAKLGKPQIGEASYYSQRKPIQSQISTDKSIAENFELLRVVDNDRYPAFFHHRGYTYTLKINKVGV